MLKQNPRTRFHTRKASTNNPLSKKSTNFIQNQLQSIQNINHIGKSLPFNTKGYYSSSQPYAQDYLKAKQQVFKKYRNPNQQLVVIDPKLTKASIYIQKGLLKANNNYQNQNTLNKQKVINNFIRNYISRKQKRQQIDSQKYFGGNQTSKRRQSVPTLSQNLDSLQPVSGSSRTNIKNNLKITINRAHSSRSNFSNKQN